MLLKTIPGLASTGFLGSCQLFSVVVARSRRIAHPQPACILVWAHNNVLFLLTETILLVLAPRSEQASVGFCWTLDATRQECCHTPHQKIVARSNASSIQLIWHFVLAYQNFGIKLSRIGIAFGGLINSAIDGFLQTRPLAVSVLCDAQTPANVSQCHADGNQGTAPGDVPGTLARVHFRLWLPHTGMLLMFIAWN